MKKLLRYDTSKTFVFIDCETFNLCLNFCHNLPWQISMLKVQGDDIMASKDFYIKWDTLLKIGEEAARILVGIMQDDEESDAFRIQAIRSIGERKERMAVGVLSDLLMDTHPNVREHAALALGQIGAMSALTRSSTVT